MFIKKMVSLSLLTAFTLQICASAAWSVEAINTPTDSATTQVSPVNTPSSNSNVLIDYNTVRLDNPKLEKTLAEHYSAYTVVLTNQGPNIIELINGDIPNGVNGQTAYEVSKRNTTGRAIGWWLFTGGIGAGISAARNSSRNKATRQASAGFDDRLPLGPIGVGQSVEVNTFVPFGTKPQVKAVFKDVKTGEVLFANK